MPVHVNPSQLRTLIDCERRARSPVVYRFVRAITHYVPGAAAHLTGGEAVGDVARNLASVLVMAWREACEDPVTEAQRIGMSEKEAVEWFADERYG